MSEAQYGTMRVDINAVDGTESKGTFRVSSSKLTFPGYLAIYDAKVGDTDEREKDDNEKDDDATPQVALPNLKQGNKVNASSVDGKQHLSIVSTGGYYEEYDNCLLYTSPSPRD